MYNERGLLPAVGYEISSTLYSLGTGIANLFDVPTIAYDPKETRDRGIDEHRYRE